MLLGGTPPEVSLLLFPMRARTAVKLLGVSTAEQPRSASAGVRRGREFEEAAAKPALKSRRPLAEVHAGDNALY